jgi:PAS domain-containing protein
MFLHNTRQVWTDSVAGRRAYDVEYRVRRHDGAYRWFKTRGVPIRDTPGNLGLLQQNRHKAAEANDKAMSAAGESRDATVPDVSTHQR